MTAKDLIEIVVSFFAGAAISAVVTVKYTKTVKQRSNTVNQNNNKAGGSIIGGDQINK